MGTLQLSVVSKLNSVVTDLAPCSAEMGILQTHLGTEGSILVGAHFGALQCYFGSIAVLSGPET